MQKKAFNTLTVSQKIKKLASLARETIRNPSKAKLFWNCVEWLQESSSPRLQKALTMILSTKEHLHTHTIAWYHLYHDLLALNQEKVREEDFLEPVFDREEAIRRWEAAVLLADVRSPFNVGSIIRTAEAFGWSEVGICGITPSIDHPRVAKTSMQTHEWIPIHHFPTINEGITYYNKRGYKVVALEIHSQASSLWNIIPPLPIVVIVGNEEFGIPQETLAIVDETVYIPLYGKKLSLNVANAFAILSAVFTERWRVKEMEKTETTTSLPPCHSSG